MKGLVQGCNKHIHVDTETCTHRHKHTHNDMTLSPIISFIHIHARAHTYMYMYMCKNNNVEKHLQTLPEPSPTTPIDSQTKTHSQAVLFAPHTRIRIHAYKSTHPPPCLRHTHLRFGRLAVFVCAVPPQEPFAFSMSGCSIHMYTCNITQNNI